MLTTTELMLHTVFVFGTLLYILSAGFCAYVALNARIVPGETNWLGKLAVYNGVTNIAFWSALSVLLIIRKVGLLLLG